MKHRLLLCAWCWALPLLARAAPPGDLRQDPFWQETFRQLAPVQSRQCAFEERRYFPFRRKPIVLTGIARLVPGYGLSLEYLAPELRIVIMDGQGVLLREAGGQRAAPPDRRVQAATAAMAAVMRFDSDELARDFSERGTRQGEAWTLTLTPRDPTLGDSLGSIVVSGAQGRLGEIQLVKSAAQRIEIILGPPSDGGVWAPATLARYFR